MADIRTLKRQFHPDGNPLVESTTIKTKERRIATGMKSELVDTTTGEVTAISTIHRVKELDDAQFVKVFADGVTAMYGLSKTGNRVFQSILQVYESTNMSGGYADTIYLPWFNDGLDGKDIGMSKRTFNRGLAELLENQFIAPRSPEAYWVNPALFFKGDRAMLIKEYRRKNRDEKIEK